MITRNRPLAVMWWWFFSTPSPRRNASQRCGSCALFEGCAPRSKNESGCTNRATIYEFYRRIAGILQIRWLIIMYSIKLPRWGYVLFSIKYTCKHHLKWVQTKKTYHDDATKTSITNSHHLKPFNSCVSIYIDCPNPVQYPCVCKLYHHILMV